MELLTVPALPTLLLVAPPPFAALRGVLAIPPWQIESVNLTTDLQTKLMRPIGFVQIESCVFHLK